MAYTSQKQLGGILNISDVDADGSTIGTNLEIAQARAVVFNQTSSNISVSLAVPNPSIVKLIHILNKGTVAITVNGMVVEPGPAYGLYWDDDDFTPQQVEGVGIVSNVETTPSVELVGNGSPIDPLSANVRIATRINNALQEIPFTDGTGGGLFVESVSVGIGTLVVVDRISGDDTFTGTQQKPFKTIQKALDSAADYAAILVLAGTYTENLIVPAGKHLLVYAYGAKDSNTVTVKGSVTFATEAADIRFKNLQFEGVTGTATIALNGTRGSMIFDNCTVENPGGANAIAVSITNAVGWYSFLSGSIYGQIILDDTNTDVEVYLENGAEPVRPTISSSSGTMVISNYGRTDYIRHTAGNLFLLNISTVGKDVNGDSIISSAASGFLSIQNVSLLQMDGTFGEIAKTGNCPYAFASVYRDPDNNDDGFTGTKILLENAVDVHANYAAPSAYTPIDDTIRGHLEGINAALVANSGGIGAVTHEDSETASLSGAGTIADPLIAEATISSAANNALTSNPDGLYVPIADAGLEEVATDNTETVDITGSGTPTDPLMAEVSISTSPNNSLTKNATGLFVEKETARFFDIDLNVSYNWLDDDVLFTKKATQTFKLPANLANSRIDIIPKGPDTNPGGQDYIDSTLSITKNGTEIGTIVITGTVLPAITFPDEVNFEANDILAVTASQQAEFNNVSLSLLAIRVL